MDFIPVTLDMILEYVAEIPGHADTGGYYRWIALDAVHNLPVDVDMGAVGSLRVGQEYFAVVG